MTSTPLKDSDPGYDMSLWYDSMPLKIGWLRSCLPWELRSCYSVSLDIPTSWTR
jgi:hypothetical protein